MSLYINFLLSTIKERIVILILSITILFYISEFLILSINISKFLEINLSL